MSHPVLTQTEPVFGVSDRYNLVNTSHIIQALEPMGFKLDGVAVAGARKEENRDKQKHLVTMKYSDMETAEGVPTILIQNSHNRSSALKFHVGYIRFACLNGLILGADDSISIRHYDDWKEKANEFVMSYTRKVARMNEEHTLMKRNTLTSIQLRTFLTEAVKLRYDPKDVLDPYELNLVRRIEDKGNDMYKTYNRVQEGLIRGLFKRQTHTEVDGEIITSPFSKANRITSNDETIRINQQLRELALAI